MARIICGLLLLLAFAPCASAQHLPPSGSTDTQTVLLAMGLFSVQNYGATGNGTTDDTLAVQRAVNAACVAGGGTVYFPKGTYLLNTFQDTGGPRRILFLGCDNFTLDGAGIGVSIIKSTASLSGGAVIQAGGILLTSTPGTYNTSFSTQKWYVFTPGATYKTLTGTYTRGGASITLASASDASSFSVGDFIHIRTGQTNNGSLTEPDSEMNIVNAVDAGTGVITLRYLLAKNYAQEYFISGTTGKTSTSVTANAAVFGVANVTDRTMQNLTIRNLEFQGPSADNMFRVDQVHGGLVEHCKFTGRGWWDQNNTRGFTFQNNEQYNNNPAVVANFLGPGATGVGDLLVKDNRFYGYGFVHIHEGCYNCTVEKNVILPTVTSATEAISIKARTWNTKILHNTIFSNGTTAKITVSEGDGGGVISGNVIGGSGSPNAINFTSTTAIWDVTGNILLDGLVVAGSAGGNDTLVLANGTSSSPSLRFADADTGIYMRDSPSGENNISFVRNGTTIMEFGPGGTTQVRFLQGILFLGSDVIVGRGGAASVQIGLDSSVVTDQTLKSQDGSGTDKGGGALTIAGGNGTGTAAGGRICFATTDVGGGSASTQNTSVPWLCVPIDGGLQWITGTKPACNVGHRGTVFYVAGAGGVADTFEICKKDAADAYAWTALY